MESKSGIEEVFCVDLPVGEKIKILRKRYQPFLPVENPKRISIVSGIHGDEIEGQYVCFLLNRWLFENPEKICGIIDLYPSVNAIGIDSITRKFPFYDVDLNRVFPGSAEDLLPSQVADALDKSVKGSDYAIDIHSSNIFLREIPQIRLSKVWAGSLVPLAKMMNVDFIWVHDAVTVLESTFSHAMNSQGTQTLVVEMGVGMRITKEYGTQFLTGLLNLMLKTGILCDMSVETTIEPILSEAGSVYYLNANACGIFVPEMEHCQQVSAGEIIGSIVNPLNGETEEILVSPGNGILFTLREYPVVYEGSLIARIFGQQKASLGSVSSSLEKDPPVLLQFEGQT